MADLGPWLITARNKDHAEYLVSSRAEQRGVKLTNVAASGGAGGMWLVTANAANDEDAIKAAEAHLSDDTQVFHFDTHQFKS